MDRIISTALDDADIPFVPKGLDFYLPVLNITIRVLPAMAEMRDPDPDNVIVVRGRDAVNQLAAWIRAKALPAGRQESSPAD